jgi:hypothetical protein
VPQVIITEGAAQGLERCRRFLAEKNPQAAAKVIISIIESSEEASKPICS